MCDTEGVAVAGWETTPSGVALRKFQFLQEIAAGGFGSVYLAKLIPPGGEPRVVAVKMLHRRWSDNAEIASRMRDEARLLSRIRHENIVDVIDFAVIEGRSAVVMELLEAVDLRVLIDDCVARHRGLPTTAALEIGACVARALDAAYNRTPEQGGKPLRVIHRDIKPSNVMVDATGRVKVLDFGVARADFDAREARTADLAFGSLEYMPPERLFFEPESAASDVYSLGTALYELLALEKLGKAKLRQSEQERFLSDRFAHLVARRAGVNPLPSPEFEADLLHCLGSSLSFDESKRPSAAQLAQQLDRLAARAAALGEEGLAAWAGRVVPPLVTAARGRHQGGGTLLGRVMTEDVPAPSAAARPAAPRHPDDVPEDEAPPLDLDDDSDHDEGAETALHTDMLGRDELVEGLLDDPDALDDTAWSHLEQQTLLALGNTRVGEAVAPSLRSAREPDRGRNRPGAYDGPPVLELDPDPADETVLERADALIPPPLAPTLQQPVPGLPLRGRSGPWLTDADTVLVPLADAETAMQAPLYLVDGAAGPVREPAGPVAPSRPSLPPGPAPGSRARSLAPEPWPGDTSEPPARAAQVGVRPATLVGGGMLLLALGVLIGTGIALVSGVGIAAISLPTRPDPRGAAPPAIPGAPGVMPPLDAAAAGRGATFRSMLPDTRRVVARCDGASQAGTDAARVPGERFSECTVTAIDGRRQRRTVVLSDVEARTYLCFADGAERCD